MQMGMSTMGSGWMTKLMAMASIAIWTGPSTRDLGKRINSMAWAWKPGPMVPSTTDSTCKARSMGKEPSRGPMDPPIMENLLTIISKGMESIIGPTAENTKGPG